jgi:hypothetical protein
MPRKDERTVWERVREALRDARLSPTQVSAAAIIGGEQGSISDWNKPNRGPTIANARAIGKKTNTCVEWLLTGEGPKHPGPPEDPLAEQLWNLWGRLPEGVRGRIVGIAEENALPVPKRGSGKSSDDLHPRTG